MTKKFFLTRESYNKLEEELNYLSTTKRVEIAKNLKAAAEYGDLKENSEFDAEKQNQAVVESRILEIKNILKNSSIVEHNNEDNNLIGKKITLYDFDFEEEVTYTVVDRVQADPLNGLISDDSPIVKALINKNIDDIVKVDLPDGYVEYKIIDIK